MKVKEYDVVVLGAGVAGLSFAWEYAKNGKKVLVLEKAKVIGGLNKTVWYKGFGFDYCAHRFHSANKEVLRRVRQLMGKEFVKKNKQSRIFMYGRFLKYPFDIPQLLLAMPKKLAVESVVGFLMTRFRSKLLGRGNVRTYKEWFLSMFGSGLYKVMCLPYTKKFWHMDPGRISADWADQRFQTVKIRQLLKVVIGKFLRFQFESGKLEDELYPDGGSFYYAKKGAGEIPRRMSEEIRKLKGKILVRVDVVSVRNHTTKLKMVKYIYRGKKYQVSAPVVVSTIPLHSMVGLITKRVPKVVKMAMDRQKYMNMIFVNLIVDKASISVDSWLYFPNKSILFNRLVEFKNWSLEMVKGKDKTAICLDVSCYKNDKVWSMSDEELIKRCSEDGEKVKLYSRDEVSDGFVVRVPFAYPVYDLGYKKRVRTIVDYIEKDGMIYCLGRTGLSRYHNSDGSIEMGFELAKRLVTAESEAEGMLDYQFSGYSL